MDELLKRASSAEFEIERLSKEVEHFFSFDNPDDLEQLSRENEKLKYRIEILKAAIKKEETLCKGNKQLNTQKRDMFSINILGELMVLFDDAILRAYPGVSFGDCSKKVVPSVKHGDYQFNGAMSIASILKEAKHDKAKTPRDVASRIVEHFLSNEIIDKLEVAGPGFINVFLSTKFVADRVVDILRFGVLPPFCGDRKRVVVDFSSPNIAKEMHVGHLRSTIIGDSICRLLEYMGHDVIRLNHVGDWGTQFGMLIAHLEDKFPNYLTESPSISDLMMFYKESKTRFDNEAEFKDRAYKCVVMLQSNDPDYRKAWNLICDVSRKEFSKVYDRLGIIIEERGESFYQERMEKVVQYLTAANLLEEDEGRKIMFASGAPIPMTIVKSDGGFTYDTSDLATFRQRVEEEAADWLVYVTDAGQAAHFDSLFACAKRIGWYPSRDDGSKKLRVDHVTFGVVIGDDKKKFKTRSGDTVRLVDLLDEGLKRAAERLNEKESARRQLSQEEFDQAQSAIAYGCIKYSDLCHNRNHAYIFSFDKMLQEKGNTAVYMLYAYTRIRSIARCAKLSESDLIEARKNASCSLQHPLEIKLAKQLVRFPEFIVRITEEFYLHSLCEFMYDLASVFTEFYDSCCCVEMNKSGDIINVNMNRIFLCDATASILRRSFDILGITPVEKM